MLAPKELTAISDQMWTLKYQNRKRPILALSDEAGEVNLIGDMTQQAALEAQLESFRDYQIQQLKKSHPDMVLLDKGVRSNSKTKICYFKFVTQAIDQKVFNYYFFTVIEGKILIFTFNCITKLQKKWESAADQIVASVTAK